MFFQSAQNSAGDKHFCPREAGEVSSRTAAKRRGPPSLRSLRSLSTSPASAFDALPRFSALRGQKTKRLRAWKGFGCTCGDISEMGIRPCGFKGGHAEKSPVRHRRENAFALYALMNRHAAVSAVTTREAFATGLMLSKFFRRSPAPQPRDVVRGTDGKFRPQSRWTGKPVETEMMF